MWRYQQQNDIARKRCVAQHYAGLICSIRDVDAAAATGAPRSALCYCYYL